MDEAAPQAAGTARWCRKCGQPVTVTGPEFTGTAVHTATGLEDAPDGHLAAPTDQDPAQRLESQEDAERELEALTAEFGGDYEFGYDRFGWDAWPHLPYRGVLHADGPAALREKVEAALGRTRL